MRSIERPAKKRDPVNEQYLELLGIQSEKAQYFAQEHP
jgi:hypothetical protein